MSRKMKGGRSILTKLTETEKHPTGINCNVFIRGDDTQEPITKRYNPMPRYAKGEPCNLRTVRVLVPVGQRMVAAGYQKQPWYKKLFKGQQKYVNDCYTSNTALGPLPNPSRSDVFA